jgi:hypothetical protein
MPPPTWYEFERALAAPSRERRIALVVALLERSSNAYVAANSFYAAALFVDREGART